MTPESFVLALQHLDPGSRALLDLSVHRGLDDHEIADLLGADPGYVSSSRDAAIAQLAADLGMHGDPERVREALGEMPEDAWRRQLPANGERTVGQWGSGAELEVSAEPELPAVEPAPEVAEPEPEVAEPEARVAEPEPAMADAAPAALEAGRRRRTRLRPLLLLVLVVAAGVAIVLATSGGGSKSTSNTTATPSPAPSTSAPVKGGVALQSLSPSSPAKGAARLAGRRLTLTVSGLPKPAGSYEVWLYNDEIDTVPVTSFRSGNATVKAKLPKSSTGYRYLDVSLEPADGNPNHSGDSVLRVPLRALR